MRALNIIIAFVLVFVAFAATRASALSTSTTSPKVKVVAVRVLSASPQSSSAPSGAQTGAENANARNPVAQTDSNLPGTSSALPLISVIGFGVLVGGIASALKTR